MSSFKDNQIYKKTSFLASANSKLIDEMYSQYLTDPNELSQDWKSFFDGLGDDTELILQNFNGPSWSPKKKITKLKKITENKDGTLKEDVQESKSVEQAAKDSVRAIMLIRAYRIRGHLIANLDPLDIQKKEEHPELKPETYGFTKKDYDRKIFLDGVLGLQNASLKKIIEILKKTYSSKIGYEFMHMGDPEEKAWIRNRVEGPEKKFLLLIKEKKQFSIS